MIIVLCTVVACRVEFIFNLLVSSEEGKIFVTCRGWQESWNSDPWLQFKDKVEGFIEFW
jgi:hypothetical protein